MINNIKKIILKKVPCMKNFIQFFKKLIKNLLNNSNKVNIISFNYTQKLGFKI